MNNLIEMDQILSQVLDQWALRAQGITLPQRNPRLFMDILRAQGLEIVKTGELQKVNHNHKVIRNEVEEAYRTLTAARTRLAMLEDQKTIIVKEDDGS